MTVIATNLVDNKTKVISTVTGSINEDSQSALDVTKLIDSTSEPRVSVVNVHHEILGTGKVTLLFDKREILELKGRGNYGLKKDEEKERKKQKENFQIFNCTYGKSFKIKEILDKILKISGSNKKIGNIYNKKNINVNILVNSRKAKKVLGWTPKTSIHKGIELTINWFKKNTLNEIFL